MKILNLILLAGILVLSSCSKGENNNTDVESPQGGENFSFYTTTRELYNNAQKLRPENGDDFEFEKVERTGTILNIVVSYQDNCETSKFEIIWNEILLESYPMQTTLLIKRVSSNCNLDTKTKKETLSIDLVKFIGNIANATIVHVSNLSKTPNQENADVSGDDVVITNDQ